MTVTPTGLTRAAGMSAAAAGLLFIGIQIHHPHLDATSVQSTEMAVRDTAKIVMAALALAGFAGMYLSQVRRNGILGLVGYLVVSAGYLSILGTAFVAAFVLPSVARFDAGYAEDVIAAAEGHSPAGDIGTLLAVSRLQGGLFLAGGLLFGVALFRAGVLARWATVLLAAGGLVSIALSLLPEAFYRFLAYPNAIAMIGLGVSLWRSQRQVPSDASSGVETGSLQTSALPAAVPAPAVR